MYDFEDFALDVRYFKQIPQFANLTTQEIKTLLTRISRWENDAYYTNRDARLAVERAADSCYAETCKDPVLPEGEVEVIPGIIIMRHKLDERGFISLDTIALGIKKFKLYLGEKSIYL